MSQLLHLAKPDDLAKLMPMVADFHKTLGLNTDDAHRETALVPLLEGSPHGAVWLIGPTMAPVGYVAVSFGWSIEFGGMDGMIDEFYIRQTIRGRGMGTEALTALQKTLSAAGLTALSLEASEHENTAANLYKRCGFQPRDHRLMTWAPAQGPKA